MTAVAGSPGATTRTAAALCVGTGVGFGVPIPYALRYLHAHGELPRVLGFRAYGDGPFERLGTTAFTGLLAAFLLICAAEVQAGRLLWHGRRSGAVLALALVPVAAPFWRGLALPVPPSVAVVRTALIVASLRGSRPS